MHEPAPVQPAPDGERVAAIKRQVLTALRLAARHPEADVQPLADALTTDLLPLLAAPKQDALREAARALVAALDAADPAMVNVCHVAQLHGIPYNGPTYGTELAALRAALATEGGSNHA
jgi:hypothetical protein